MILFPDHILALDQQLDPILSYNPTPDISFDYSWSQDVASYNNNYLRALAWFESTNKDYYVIWAGGWVTGGDGYSPLGSNQVNMIAFNLDDNFIGPNINSFRFNGSVFGMSDFDSIEFNIYSVGSTTPSVMRAAFYNSDSFTDSIYSLPIGTSRSTRDYNNLKTIITNYGYIYNTSIYGYPGYYIRYVYNTLNYNGVYYNNGDTIFYSDGSINEGIPKEMIINTGMFERVSDEISGMNVELDLKNIYDPNYKYQMSYDNSNWTDFTNDVYVNADMQIWAYKFDEFINHNVYFRVLDSSNNVIDSKTLNINEQSMERAIIVKKSFDQDYIYYEADFSQFSQFAQYDFDYTISNSRLLSDFDFTIDTLTDESKYVLKVDLRKYNSFNFSFNVLLGNYSVTSELILVNDTSEEMANITLDNLDNGQNLNGFDGLVSTVNVYLVTMSQYFKIFTDLFVYAFNKLNIVIRSAIITVSIIFVIAKIVHMIWARGG